MDIKKFERFLELNEVFKTKSMYDENREVVNEFFDFKKYLEKLLFDNQTSKERIITRLKITLNDAANYTIYNNGKSNEALNELKVIKEIMNLIDVYDWKFTYDVSEKQISIWEENGDGLIKNHNIWNLENNEKDILYLDVIRGENNKKCNATAYYKDKIYYLKNLTQQCAYEYIIDNILHNDKNVIIHIDACGIAMNLIDIFTFNGFEVEDTEIISVNFEEDILKKESKRAYKVK